VREHGEHHVHCGKRIKEVQEVHEGQMRVLLERHTNGEQGEGPPESSSTEVTHPSGQNQELSSKIDRKGWLVAYYLFYFILICIPFLEALQLSQVLSSHVI